MHTEHGEEYCEPGTVICMACWARDIREYRNLSRPRSQAVTGVSTRYLKDIEYGHTIPGPNIIESLITGYQLDDAQARLTRDLCQPPGTLPPAHELRERITPARRSLWNVLDSPLALAYLDPLWNVLTANDKFFRIFPGLRVADNLALWALPPRPNPPQRKRCWPTPAAKRDGSWAPCAAHWPTTATTPEWPACTSNSHATKSSTTTGTTTSTSHTAAASTTSPYTCATPPPDSATPSTSNSPKSPTSPKSAASCSGHTPTTPNSHSTCDSCLFEATTSSRRPDRHRSRWQAWPDRTPGPGKPNHRSNHVGTPWPALFSP